jgi:putative flippase GtrA
MAVVAGTSEIVGARIRQVVGATELRFALVGLGSTLAHLSLFTVMLRVVGTSQMANLVALIIATVANTAVNRRWTFGVRGSTAALRQHVQAFAVFLVTWALSGAALAVLHRIASDPPPLVQVAVVGLSMAGSTVLRFVAMRVWIFRSVA